MICWVVPLRGPEELTGNPLRGPEELTGNPLRGIAPWRLASRTFLVIRDSS